MLSEPVLLQWRMCESVFKILLVGDSKVGKTCLVEMYVKGMWLDTFKATIGGELVARTCICWVEGCVCA